MNLVEVVQKLVDRKVDDRTIRATMDGLGLNAEPFDAEQALQAGLLRRITRSKGLSLGDRACLALGISLSRRREILLPAAEPTRGVVA